MYELQFLFVDPATPELSGCPVEFGDVNVNTNATRTVVINNPAEGGQLNITSISAQAPFTVTPSGATQLEPNSSLNLNVSFQSGDIGLYSGQLTVEHDGPGGPLVCDLRAVAVSVDIQIFTASLDFGEVPMFEVDSARAAFRANGNTNLVIQTITTEAPFSLSFNEPLSMTPTAFAV